MSTNITINYIKDDYVAQELTNPSGQHGKARAKIGAYRLRWSVAAIRELRGLLSKIMGGEAFAESFYADRRNRTIRAYRPLANSTIRIEFGKCSINVTENQVSKFLNDRAFYLLPDYPRATACRPTYNRQKE